MNRSPHGRFELPFPPLSLSLSLLLLLLRAAFYCYYGVSGLSHPFADSSAQHGMLHDRAHIGYSIFSALPTIAAAL